MISRFVQCADGLLDDSVWGFQSEWSKRTVDGVTHVLHQQVWKPLRFGPQTEKESKMWVCISESLARARPKIEEARMRAMERGL